MIETLPSRTFFQSSVFLPRQTSLAEANSAQKKGRLSTQIGYLVVALNLTLSVSLSSVGTILHILIFSVVC